MPGIFSRKLLVPISGYVIIFSIPTRWLLTGLASPELIDYGLLIAGISIAIIGLFAMTAWRSSQTSIDLNLVSGMFLLVVVSLFSILQPAFSSNARVLAVGFCGAFFVILSFALTVYKKTALPIELPIEDRPVKDTEVARTKAHPRRVYGSDVPWYSKASALMLLDRYEEALECTDIAIKINPNNEIAWVIRGNALSKLNKQVDALKAFNKAIKLNPLYEVAWNNKGNALSRMKNYDDALRCYDEAIKIRPSYREAWVNKGYVLAKLGKYKDAASCADKVISFTPKARAEV